MKYFLFTISIFTFLSCTTVNSPQEEIRNNFTQEEQKIINLSKGIIKETYFATLITVDKNGQPRARVMEPFEPDNNFIIWLATNPKSRKVAQLENNSRATLHYFDKNNLGYVSLMGNAFLVNNEVVKSQKFKDGWDKFYKNQKEDYLLIKFIPKTLELISVTNQYNGDSLTWKPHQVRLRK
jgi:general stress protein 26